MGRPYARFWPPRGGTDIVLTTCVSNFEKTSTKPNGDAHDGVVERIAGPDARGHGTGQVQQLVARALRRFLGTGIHDFGQPLWGLPDMPFGGGANFMPALPTARRHPWQARPACIATPRAATDSLEGACSDHMRPSRSRAVAVTIRWSATATWAISYACRSRTALMINCGTTRVRLVRCEQAFRSSGMPTIENQKYDLRDLGRRRDSASFSS